MHLKTPHTLQAQEPTDGRTPRTYNQSLEVSRAPCRTPHTQNLSGSPQSRRQGLRYVLLSFSQMWEEEEGSTVCTDVCADPPDTHTLLP